jgi:UDP-2-acetamido-2,6-beta-L-arabino-hexul-4-ose reductase
MLRIGITGQAGFVGTHLYNTLGLHTGEFTRIPFEDHYFESRELLEDFARKCDVIVHLAAMNRHGDPGVIYDTNIRLVKQLINAMEATGSHPHVIFSSSTQEERDNPYGRSKREGREMLEKWALRNDSAFTGMIIPNVFGPFGNPYYNSVIATFSHQLTHNEEPKIDVNGKIKLIYVAELVEEILKVIRAKTGNPELHIPFTKEIHVSEILEFLNGFMDGYFKMGIIPELRDPFERNLFNTFRSYIDPVKFFPYRLTPHTDARGTFAEVIRLGSGGQVSFSTTNPGITRGNHFHTRKIERFAVIKGQARIQLRRIGTKNILSFNLDGNEPSFVDMPVWYTHNITNTGHEDLYTIFWINEFYDPDDPDTYYEEV